MHRKVFILSVLPAAVIGGLLLWYFLTPRLLSSVEAKSPRDRLAAQIPTAVLLWSRDGVVTASRLNPWKPKNILSGENPRWSPDGKQFVFTRKHDVWLMKNDLSTPVRVMKNVVTEYGTGAYWTDDSRAIVVIRRDDPRKVIKLNLSSGKTRLIHNEGKPPYRGYRLAQCAELRFRERYLLVFTPDEGHRSMVIDLKAGKYLSNKLMRKGDCEPAWSPDGKFIVMTRRVRGSRNRPLYVAYFDAQNRTLSDSTYFIGQGRCRRASVSNDAKYVLYESSGQLFCWKVGDLVDKPRNGIQLTVQRKNTDPSLFIFPGKPPAAFR